MNHTSAPTAPQSPTTRKTSGIDTAPTATSGMPQRIDSFIKQKLVEAESAAGSGISDSADRAARLGFVNCANSRYSEFLAAFRSSSQLTEMYREKYPNSLFLPWKALHAVIKALDLWVDLPVHYRGAVPPEQLPWMEIFELDPNDRVTALDVDGLLPEADDRFRRVIRAAVQNQFHNGFDPRDMPLSERPTLLVERQREIIQTGRIARPVHDLWASARDSFFVVAPPEAFSTKEDWLSRLRKLVTDLAEMEKVAPDDPLVIRFCRGGCLVVAAWGDEAAAINDLTKELKL